MAPALAWVHRREGQPETAVVHLERYYAELGRQPALLHRVAGLRVGGRAEYRPRHAWPCGLCGCRCSASRLRAQAALRLLSRRPSAACSPRFRLTWTLSTRADVAGRLRRATLGTSARGRDGLRPRRRASCVAVKRLGCCRSGTASSEEATGGHQRQLEKFRYVLTDDDRAVWAGSGFAGGVPAVPAMVSELRILDVLLWMSVQTLLPSRSPDELPTKTSHPKRSRLGDDSPEPTGVLRLGVRRPVYQHHPRSAC